MSNRTVRRFLHKIGLHYLQARKKGLMSEKDKRERLQFAKKMKRDYPLDVWTNSVTFYLDGVSYYHKMNPSDQARAPSGRVWRKHSEELRQSCTSKGSKEGSGGRVVRLMVAISYGKGVIECQLYEDLNSGMFAIFVDEKFDSMFLTAEKNESRLFLQDNAPNQNLSLVNRVLYHKRATQLRIPARSSHINPIENFFQLVKKELRRQALQQNITHETFDQFSTRIIRTMKEFAFDLIDRMTAWQAVWIPLFKDRLLLMDLVRQICHNLPALRS